MNGTLTVDTINEKTAGNGVFVEGVKLFGDKIKATNYLVGTRTIIDGSAGASLSGFELKHFVNGIGTVRVLASGETGDISSNGLLTSVSMKTNNATILGPLDVSGNATFDDKVIINGELIFNSTATKITSTNTDVSDNLIVLNSGYSGNNMFYSKAIVDRGDLDNAFIGWDESEDKFVLATTLMEVKWVILLLVVLI